MATDRRNDPTEAALLEALRAVRRGDFKVRLPAGQTGIAGEIAEAFNDIVELNLATERELRRISRIVGREGRIRQRASVPAAGGEWARNIGDEVGHDPLDPRCVPVARLAGTRHIVE